MSSARAMSAGFVYSSAGRLLLPKSPASETLSASNSPRSKLRSAQPSAALGLSIIQQVTHQF